MGLALVLLIVILVSIGDSPSQYYPHGKDGGYSESIIDRNIVVARFSGNSQTSIDDALHLSKFRAYEYCFKQEKLAFIIKIENVSERQTVYKTAVMDLGQVTVGNTHSESVIYPIFDTYVLCQEDIYLLDVVAKNISKEDMKSFVNDLMGATQITEVPETSPNAGVLWRGDIITNLNDYRIANDLDLFEKLNKVPDKENLQVTVYRNGKPVALPVTAANHNTEYLQQIKREVTIACNNPRHSELKKRPICKSMK